MAFAALRRLFGPSRPPPLEALWARIVVLARRPGWYLNGGVPDTLDGRFDMIALVLSLVLVRLERDGDTDAQVALTERFVDDMDGNLRQSGVGDMVVGKHVGKMMGALGGRLGSYRAALDGGDLERALARNLYRGDMVDAKRLAWTAAEARRLAAAIDSLSGAALRAGNIPA